MKKVIVSVILILLMSILMIGCASTSPQEPPELTITIGDQQLDYVVAKNHWNGAEFDREDTFKTILEKTSESEIPYIEIGSTATISFTSNPPMQIAVYKLELFSGFLL